MNHRYREIILFIQENSKFFFASVLVILMVVIACRVFEEVRPKNLSVTFFDVGQGDAIFIETPSGKQILIDGGRSNYVRRLLSQEMSFFDNSLDMIIATHNDSDHITGLVEVIKHLKVDHILLGSEKNDGEITNAFLEVVKEERESGATVKRAIRGMTIDMGDEVILHVLHPRERVSYNDTNDMSVTVLMRYKEHSFLLTGDLSKEYEAGIITSDMPKRVTVFKAGHHGSDTSSGELLLSRVRPVYGVISAGENNTYGHPSQDVLGRLQKFSTYILSTIEHGSITFISDGRLLEVVSTK
jgi:competence protein ComEC